jgi:hypothetical protein
VNVEFLVAEFGTGSPYASVATTTASFAVGDFAKIATAPWTLGPTSSTHLCLAVQVSTPVDPFVAPGLNGNTPGWPATDLKVINDNNKAQRNMSVHYGLSGFGSTHYAIVRNASEKLRDFELRLNADAQTLKGYADPTVQVQGGEKSVPFRPETTIVLKAMNPGEYRWVAFAMTSFKTSAKVPLPVDFLELVDNNVVNGYRISVVAAAANLALRELLMFAAATFQRLQLQFRLDSAGEVVKAARTSLRAKSLTQAAYLKFVAQTKDATAKTVDGFLGDERRDNGLDVASSLEQLLKSAQAKNFGNTFASHATLLNKLDVATTLVQKTTKT